MIEQTLGQKPG
jgi:hypothetical protein